MVGCFWSCVVRCVSFVFVVYVSLIAVCGALFDIGCYVLFVDVMRCCSLVGVRCVLLGAVLCVGCCCVLFDVCCC